MAENSAALFAIGIFADGADEPCRIGRAAGAGIVSYPETGILTVSTEAANEYVDSIITEVYREMDKLCNDLVPQEELEMVKNYMLGDLCRSYEGPFSLSDAWIYIETG